MSCTTLAVSSINTAVTTFTVFYDMQQTFQPLLFEIARHARQQSCRVVTPWQPRRPQILFQGKGQRWVKGSAGVFITTARTERLESCNKHCRHMSSDDQGKECNRPCESKWPQQVGDKVLHDQVASARDRRCGRFLEIWRQRKHEFQTSKTRFFSEAPITETALTSDTPEWIRVLNFDS